MSKTAILVSACLLAIGPASAKECALEAKSIISPFDEHDSRIGSIQPPRYDKETMQQTVVLRNGQRVTYDAELSSPSSDWAACERMLQSTITFERIRLGDAASDGRLGAAIKSLRSEATSQLSRADTSLVFQTALALLEQTPMRATFSAKADLVKALKKSETEEKLNEVGTFFLPCEQSPAMQCLLFPDKDAPEPSQPALRLTTQRRIE